MKLGQLASHLPDPPGAGRARLDHGGSIDTLHVEVISVITDLDDLWDGIAV